MPTPGDAELLRRYADDRSQAAFAELVRRHLDFVYSAAVRQTGGDEQLAQDVAQLVFTALARKAAALSRHPVLVGWLYRATRYAAIDAVRTEQRRRLREREAQAMNEPSIEPEDAVDWERLRRLLDAAMAELDERDRHAVLLRFFEGRSYAEVGAGLRLGENAARMRVDRALEKLRLRLRRRGLVSTEAALAVALGDHAVAAAPAGLASAVTSAALAGAETAPGAVVALRLLFMSKINTAIISGVVAAGLATAVLSWRLQPARQEIAALRRTTDRLQEELRERQSRRPALPTSTASIAPPGALPTALGDMAGRVAKRNAEFRARAAADATRPEPSGAYRNRGQATPENAYQTFAWASDCGDIAALSKLICFDGAGRKTAETVLASMPDSVRAKWSTPEELYALFIAADALSYPPPRADVLAKARVVPLGPDRVVMRGPLSVTGGHTYQRTPEGWKYVFAEAAVEGFANQMVDLANALGPEGKAGPPAD